MAKNLSLFNAAKLVAMVTIVSKFVGFLRDVIIAKYYGAGMVSDAYFYAYQIPALAIIILGGVGGPFHSAIVSVFAKFLPPDVKNADEKANKLYNTFLTVSFIVFAVLGVLIFIFAKPIMQIIINSGSPELVSLAAMHLRIMSPVFVIGGIIGIYYGILIVFREFLFPNLSPVVMSLVIIAGVMLATGDANGYVLAGATTLGAFCQLGIQFPKVRQIGFRLKPNFDFKNNPEFKQLLELLFPAILSSTVGQIYVYADMFFSSQLAEGAWSAIGYANRIFQFPVGILVTAFLVPLFPVFSNLVGRGETDEVRRYFNKGISALNFIAFPMLVAIVLLAHDAVFLVFQRGEFTHEATMMVTLALTYLGFGIIPYVFRDCITRIYYAFNDSKTPFLIAVSSILLKLLLNFFLVKKLGIGGITLSTTLVTLINATWLGLLLRKKMDMKYGIYFMNIFKTGIASVLTYFVCLQIYRHYFVTDYSSWLAVFINTCIILLLCCMIYIVFAFIMRVEFVRDAVRKVYENFRH
ncbi:MAG: murein biosynthesis integral membrane protein MurJ [Candidatus Gastranaerophilales bacterium]|nr:murein biosynthesis integral membrane protein MurJ [Candidatus Gastranaerophilales bacterium]